MPVFGMTIMSASVALCAAFFGMHPENPDSIALFSQFLGSVALILMAWSQIVATRLPGIETLFGGLDRVYVLHKWSGIVAMAAILMHDTIDADMDALGQQGFWAELGETLGEISLYGLLILVVISVATFIPYHLWKWTHRFMGLFFAAGAVHYVLELKPFDAFADPVGIYVSAFCVLGLLAYAVTLLPESARPAHGYTVESCDQTGGATCIAMLPKGRTLRYRAGQFAIVQFAAPGLTEPHPFTISAAPCRDGRIEITAKPLGDFTHRLCRDLKPGTSARVQGPFGRFVRRSGSGPEIWIAGGIGITPFLAWAEALDPAEHADIHLFWAVRSRHDAPHLDRIERAAADNPTLTLHLVVSSEGDRLNADRIAAVPELSRARVWYCGPVGLRRSLKKTLQRHGVTSRRFHYEEFEFRTGIGLRRLADRIARRLRTRLMAS